MLQGIIRNYLQFLKNYIFLIIENNNYHLSDFRPKLTKISAMLSWLIAFQNRVLLQWLQ